MPPNHRSGEHDAALILAIRQEIEAALLPVREKLEDIDRRLATGDTSMALLGQRIGSVETQCKGHREPRTDRTERKKDMHPVILAAITAAITTVANLTLVWWLSGIGSLAAKGAP